MANSTGVPQVPYAEHLAYMVIVCHNYPFLLKRKLLLYLMFLLIEKPPRNVVNKYLYTLCKNNLLRQRHKIKISSELI